MLFFVFKQKTAYEMRISDWSSDVCSSDLVTGDDIDMPAAVIALQVLRPVAPEPFVIARQALAIRRVADQPPGIGRSCNFSGIADFETDGVGGQPGALQVGCGSFDGAGIDRKSTRLNSSH